MVSFLDDSEIDYKNKKNSVHYRLVPPNYSETIVKARLYLPEIYSGGADDLTYSFVSESDDDSSDDESSTSDSSTSDSTSSADTTGATSTSSDSSTSDADSTSEDTSTSSSDDDDDSKEDEKTYEAIKLSKITSEEEAKKLGNRNYWGNQVQEAEADEEDDEKDKDKDKDDDSKESEDDMDKPVYNVQRDSVILKETNPKLVLDLDNQIVDLSFDKDYDSPDGSAEFHIPYTVDNSYNVKKGCRILIQEGYRYPNGTEDVKLVFSGYIDDVQVTEGLMDVKCKDLGELLNTQLEVEYSQMSRADIINDIITKKIGLYADIDFYELYNDVIDYTTASKSDDSDDDDTGSIGDVPADVKKAAKKIVGSTTDKQKMCHKLYNWVNQNVKYEGYSNTVKGALGTLKARGGNCCDQAHLMCALCNAVGIKTRYVHGTSCQFLDGTAAGHVWMQAYVNGKWFTMDTVSTNNQKGYGKCAGSCSSVSIVGGELGF